MCHSTKFASLFTRTVATIVGAVQSSVWNTTNFSLLDREEKKSLMASTLLLGSVTIWLLFKGGRNVECTPFSNKALVWRMIDSDNFVM